MPAAIAIDRAKAAAFWSGALAITIGVVLHLPMFWMGRHHGFRLSGMAMDPKPYPGSGAGVTKVKRRKKGTVYSGNQPTVFPKRGRWWSGAVAIPQS